MASFLPVSCQEAVKAVLCFDEVRMSCHRTLTETSLKDIQINDNKQHTPSSPNPTRLWRIFFRTDRS